MIMMKMKTKMKMTMNKTLIAITLALVLFASPVFARPNLYLWGYEWSGWGFVYWSYRYEESGDHGFEMDCYNGSCWVSDW